MVINGDLPSGNLTVCYWKWCFIVDFPIKHGGSFRSYVNLPEGNTSEGKIMINKKVKFGAFPEFSDETRRLQICGWKLWLGRSPKHGSLPEKWRNLHSSLGSGRGTGKRQHLYISFLIYPSLYLSIYLFLHWSINQSINQPTKQAINQLINQSINQINQSNQINQLINQINQSNQFICLAIYLSSYLSTYLFILPLVIWDSELEDHNF